MESKVEAVVKTHTKERQGKVEGEGLGMVPGPPICPVHGTRWEASLDVLDQKAWGLTQ